MRRGVCASFYRLKSRLRITVQMIFFFECALALVHPLARHPPRVSPRSRLFPPDFLAATLFCIAPRTAVPATPARARFELKRNLKPLPMCPPPPPPSPPPPPPPPSLPPPPPPRTPRQHHEMTHNETNEKWEFPDLSSYPRGLCYLSSDS